MTLHWCWCCARTVRISEWRLSLRDEATLCTQCCWHQVFWKLRLISCTNIPASSRCNLWSANQSTQSHVWTCHFEQNEQSRDENDLLFEVKLRDLLRRKSRYITFLGVETIRKLSTDLSNVLGGASASTAQQICSKHNLTYWIPRFLGSTAESLYTKMVVDKRAETSKKSPQREDDERKHMVCNWWLCWPVLRTKKRERPGLWFCQGRTPHHQLSYLAFFYGTCLSNAIPLALQLPVFILHRFMNACVLRVTSRGAIIRYPSRGRSNLYRSKDGLPKTMPRSNCNSLALCLVDKLAL